MNEIIKFRKWQYRAVIGIIALILMPVTTSFQYGWIDLLYAEQAGGVEAGLSSSEFREKLVSTKITCIQIIQEDYEGLKLSYPRQVLVDSVKKEIYVVDSGNSRILIYASDFYPLLSIGKTYGVESPVGLAIDLEGYLFIAQSLGKGNKKGRISVLNPSLGWKKDIFFEGFEDADNFVPNNIAISNRGYLYVTGNSYQGVVVMDKEGTFSHLLTPIDSFGKSPEEKATICDVEVDNQGNIYLLSEDMGRIYVYDSQERYLFKFGKKGGSTAKLSRPRGIAVDGGGKRIYVIDYMRHTANAYSGDGQFLFEFGGKGWGKGWFQYPTDIAVDTLGNVLVADTFNHRVQVLKIQETISIEEAKEPKPKVTIAQEVPEAKEPKPKVTIAKEVPKAKEPKPKVTIAKEVPEAKEPKPKVTIAKEVPKVKEPEPKVTIAKEVPEVKEPEPKVTIAKEVPEVKIPEYYILTSNMNLREESNTDSKLIVVMKKGEEFQILDEHEQDELNRWYFIETGSGLKGWFCGIYNGEARFERKPEPKNK